MKKRILGLATAAALITAIMPAQIAFADGAKDDLGKAPAGVWYNVNNASGYGRENFDITYSTDAYEGNYSLRINNINEIANRSIITKIPFKKTLNSGDTYRVSYWIKCENREGHYAFGNSSQDVKFTGLTPSAANEWVYCEKDVTLTIDATNFQFTFWKSNRCIDDLSIRKVNSDGTLGENVAINGNFETIKVRDEHTQFPTGWLGWYNNGYDYTQLETFMSSTAMDSYSGDRAMMVNVEQEIDHKTYTAMTYLSEGLKAGKNYKFEAYIKSISRDPRASLGHEDNTDAYGWGYVHHSNGTDMGNGWYKISKIISGSDKNYQMIKMTYWPGGVMLVDDLSVYEVDADGNVVSGAKNLVVNSGFEDVLDFDGVNDKLYYNDNWKIITKTINNTMSPTVVASDYMKFTEVAPGNYALHVNYDDYEKSNTFVKIGTKNNVPIENGVNYTVEYDIKYSSHNYNGLTLHTLGEWKNGRFGGLDVLRGKIQSVTDDGWIHCATTVDSNSTGTMFTVEVGAYCEALLDNIKVYRTDDASKTNLIPDGDFQETKKRNTEELENVVAYSANAEGKAVVSWINAFGTIENLKLYVDDEEQEIALDSEAEAFNQAVIEGLTPGETYTFKVTATINGVDKEYTKTITMKNYRDWYHAGIGAWDSDAWGTFIRDNEAVGYANTNISVVTDEKASGDASAMINGNIPSVLDNVYAGIEQTVELDRNKLYRITFKAKGENVNRFKLIEAANLGEGEGSFWIENAFTLTDEWTEYTILLDNNDKANANGAYLYDMEKEGSYDARLLLSTDWYTGKIWIDDVEVYEVNPDDTVTPEGENLIIDGGFETPELILSDAVFSVNGEMTDKLVTGTMNVSVTAVNEGNLLLIVALYKDGALYSTSIMEKTTSALSENYNTSIDVPALTDGVYTGKVFYWNGSSTLSAHRLPATIAE